MIQIDKTDSLYKYLLGLGVEEVDKSYLELAQNGRFKLNDVKQYFQEVFEPSKTQDIDEKELEKVKINRLLAEGEFDNLQKLSLIKPAQRHKFVKFYSQAGRVFVASYPDMRVKDVTEDYKKM